MFPIEATYKNNASVMGNIQCTTLGSTREHPGSMMKKLSSNIRENNQNRSSYDLNSISKKSAPISGFIKLTFLRKKSEVRQTFKYKLCRTNSYWIGKYSAKWNPTKYRHWNDTQCSLR